MGCCESNTTYQTDPVDKYCGPWQPTKTCSQDFRHKCWMNVCNDKDSCPRKSLILDPTNTPFLQRAYEGKAEETLHQVVLKKGDVVRVTLINEDTHSSHPIHLHGHNFAILGVGVGTIDYSSLNLTNPLYHDSFQIMTDPHQNNWAVIQFEAKNAGSWFFHCHIDWHLGAGFATVFTTDPHLIPPPPQQLPTSCTCDFPL